MRPLAHPFGCLMPSPTHLKREPTLALLLMVGLAAPLSAQAKPPCSGSLSLSGQQYVEVANAPALQPAKACTYEAWFRAKALKKSRILSKGDGLSSRSDRSFDLTYSQNSQVGILAEFFLVQGSARPYIWVAGPKNVPVNQWTHVAATFDSQKREAILYVNGVLVKKVQTPQGATLYQSTKPLYIGATPPWSVYFNGEINQPRVWNVALSAAQVKAFMNVTSHSLPGLVASWPLSGHLFDLRGGHDGKSVGAISWVGGCATWTNYHKGTKGPFGIPSLTPDKTPAIGTTVTIQTDNASKATATGALVVGLKPVNMPLFGGKLLADPLIVFGLSIGASGAKWPFRIPNDKNAIGTPLFTQLGVFYGNNPQPGLSRGLQFMIGN